jgi:deferrochelatase/peroxidase EfeB
MAAPDLSSERDDIQGIVASGYGHLPHAAYLLFAIDEPGAANDWLGQLARSATTARRRVERRALGVALTAIGLAAIGLSERVRDGFALEFTTGMSDDAHRRRILGDVGPNCPEGWLWGGRDSHTVDVLLLLFGESERELEALTAEQLEEVRGATLVQRLSASSEEVDHFGFRDRISQPSVAGLRSGSPAQTIQTGEFLLGYPNEYRQYTQRPLIDPRHDPSGLLPDDAAGSGLRDLGRNGSYLVFRHLSQDVPAFWQVGYPLPSTSVSSVARCPRSASSRGLGSTTRAPGTSCSPGFLTTRRASPTWSGCAGARGSSAASAARPTPATGAFAAACAAARPAAARPR